MPERWRDELARLEGYDAPTGVIDEARSRPQVPGDDGPSRRSRVTAGVVAFAVFVVAASFVWRAFDTRPQIPTQDPGGLPVLEVTFTAAGTIEPGMRRIDTTIEYADARHTGDTSTTPDGAIIEWVAADDLPPLAPGPAVGSTIRLEADGADPRALLGSPGAWPGIDSFERIDRIPDAPGEYVIVFAADYDEGTALDVYRIRVVEPGTLQLVMTEGGQLDAAEASAFVDGHEVEGFRSSSSYAVSDTGIGTAPVAPDFVDVSPLSVAAGAPLLVATPADSAHGSFFHSYQDARGIDLMDVDLLTGDVTVWPEPGRYLLAVDTVWKHGTVGWGSDGTRETARFFFPVEVTGSAAATPDPVEPSVTTPPTRPQPIEVTTPAAGSTVSSPITVSGTADVFEAVVTIWVMDQTNNRIAESTALASCGTGCRGNFSIDVPYAVGTTQPSEIWVFEVSAMDGSRQNVVKIPVTLTPTDDPIASALEGPWRGADGEPVPEGLSGTRPVVYATEGPDHCGWASATFLFTGWPIGAAADSETTWRQYVRDPHGLFFRDGDPAGFAADADLPDSAAPSGHQRGDWRIWLDEGDASAIYVVNAADGSTERWPRLDPPALCK